MLTVTVAQDGSGDFASIAEAVLAVPYEEEALVQVGPGIYREKLVCEKRCITLRGDLYGQSDFRQKIEHLLMLLYGFSARTSCRDRS